MEADSMKASDLFVKCLEAEGVDTIFGVPGEENADLMISLADSGIEFIICRHEQAAAFMADMYGRLTGRPGVCLSTLGPGATNLVTGVASATLDYSPLVAIVGQAGTQRLHKESHQNMDSISMFRPVSKWAATVRDPGNIPEMVRKAFRTALADKPGAAVIELPEDIAKQDTPSMPMPGPRVKQTYGVDVNAVDRAAELIRAAEAPLVLIGNGVVRERMKATRQIEAFLEKTGAYAANTFMGKGGVSARNPRCLFCVGLGVRDAVIEAFDRADLVICAGYDMIEWRPDRWNAGRPKKIIHIDRTRAEADASYLVDAEMAGGIAENFEALNRALEDCAPRDLPEFAQLRNRILEILGEHDADPSWPMKPQRILHDLRRAMRDEDILVSDVGAHKMWVARQFRAYRPGTCFISNGFCSMGFALPAAIVAKKLFPHKNVVALAGDGGFLMNVQDLITAVKYKIPLTVLIWNDNGYGLIGWKQAAAYCRTSHVELLNPDFAQLARAFGCNGVEITAPDQLTPALQSAFTDASRPTVITMPVDYGENLKLTARFGQLQCFLPHGQPGD